MVKTKGTADVGNKKCLYKSHRQNLKACPHSMHQKKSWQNQVKKSNQWGRKPRKDYILLINSRKDLYSVSAIWHTDSWKSLCSAKPGRKRKYIKTVAAISTFRQTIWLNEAKRQNMSDWAMCILLGLLCSTVFLYFNYLCLFKCCYLGVLKSQRASKNQIRTNMNFALTNIIPLYHSSMN